jgi:hypothetical protein
MNNYKKMYEHILFLIVLLLISSNGVCAVPDSDELFRQSIYTKNFENQMIDVSSEHMEFFISNSTYILDIIRYTDPTYFASVLPRLSEYKVEGTPKKIRVASSLSKVDLDVYNIAPGKFLFVGLGETKIFKILITGKLFVEIEINKVTDSENQCAVKFTIGFKPNSKVMSAVMQPIASMFTSQMDELADVLLAGSKNYVTVIKRIMPTHLTNKNIISQISLLHKENINLKTLQLEAEKNLESLLKERQSVLDMRQSVLDMRQSDLEKRQPGLKEKQIDLPKENRSKLYVYLIIGLIIGGICGLSIQKFKDSSSLKT